MQSRSNESKRPLAVGALILAVALFAFGLAWTAWLSDDAFITFRCMDQFVHGEGLRWNQGERVQAFTNPLWLLLLAPFYALTENIAAVAYGASFLATAVALFLVARAATGPVVAAFGILVLAGSKAFLDYSSSGLENPLLHVALLLGVGAFLGGGDPARRAGRVALATSMAFVTRPDSALFMGVLCVAAWVQSPTLSTTRRMLIGWAPALGWEAFSLVYFGTWVPNTAIAKVGAGLPRDEVLAQGARYLLNSMRWDPLTLGTLACVVLVTLLRGLRRRESIVALGLILHLAYVVRVGGDFMSGRFLTAPFVVAVFLMVRLRLDRRVMGAAALAIVALATFHPRSSWGPRPDALAFLDAGASGGITDERTIYYGYTGLLSKGHPAWGRLVDGDPYPPAGKARERFEAGERVQQQTQVGLLGFLAPRELHLIDVFGLGDPLLARLPLTNARGAPIFRHKLDEFGRFWRPGHLRRNPPAGYRQSLETNENRIQDPALARYYGAVRSLTRAPIWSRQRWEVLVGFHRGRYGGDLAKWRSEQPARDPG
ncbi:hypothetical protein [Planctomycetes bacterium Poly30]|uniref:hypothetical protein n=1 Tax=Saltatorellus ferox TaxID=2528018 RepID=UPI0011A18465